MIIHLFFYLRTLYLIRLKEIHHKINFSNNSRWSERRERLYKTYSLFIWQIAAVRNKAPAKLATQYFSFPFLFSRFLIGTYNNGILFEPLNMPVLCLEWLPLGLNEQFRQPECMGAVAAAVARLERKSDRSGFRRGERREWSVRVLFRIAILPRISFLNVHTTILLPDRIRDFHKDSCMYVRTFG